MFLTVVVQSMSCPTLCDPRNCNMPDFPVLHYLPEFSHTHVHWVNDAIQWYHPLLSPSLPALNLAQHLGIFQWVHSSHQVAKVLEFQLQHQLFQWIFRVDFLSDWLVWSPCCAKDSQESSLAPQFESINSSLLSTLYGPTLTSVHDQRKNHSFDYRNLSVKLYALNTLSRFVIAFLPRTKCILVAAVTVCRDFGAQENEIWHYFPKYPPGKLACHTEHA